MERSIIATSERYYQGYTYQVMTEARATGGKITKTVSVEYDNIPLVVAKTRKSAKWSQDGIYKNGTLKVHIANRLFEVYEFTPSIKDRIKKGDILYRIIDIKDYTEHPHINVWSITLKRIEYHG